MHSEIRQQEYTRLRSMLDQRLDVVVVGRHGMGKTELLDRLVRDWQGLVVQVPCNRSESGVRLSGMVITLAAMRAFGDTETIAELESMLTTGLTPAETAHAMLACVRGFTELPSALVIIDGVDEMDTESQEILGHFLRRFTGTPVRVVLAARQILDDSPLAGLPAVELLPLDRAASVALAHELVTEPLCADAALTAATSAGGNPLALRHILQMMTERQRRGDAPFPRPLRTSGFGNAFAHEILGEISEGAQEILRTLALAPLTSILPLQRQHPQLWEELIELEARGIVERDGSYLRIANALVRSSLYWGTSPHDRAALRAAAQSAEDSTAPMHRWHRSFAEFDEDTAAGLLEAAGPLLREGHPDTAVEFAERALMLSPDPADLAELLLDLAEQLFAYGDSVFSDRYVRFARSSADRQAQLRALRLTIQTDFHRRQAVPSRSAHFWGARQNAEAPNEMAAVQLSLAQCHVERHELAEAEELVTAAGRLSESFTPATETMYECAAMMLEAHRGRDDRTLRLFQSLSASAPTHESVATAITVARCLILTEHYPEARAVLETLEHGLPESSMWKGIVPLLRAELEIRAGEFQLVAYFVNQARQRRATDTPLREDQLLLLECRLMLMQGRASDVEEFEQELVRRAGAARNRSALAQLSAIQGAHLLQAGLPAEAVWHLQRCEELASGGLNPNIHRHEPDLVEALLRVGRREHAALLLQRFRKRLDRFPTRWGELAAQRCEALLETGERSLELYRRTLRGWKPTDSDHEKAKTAAAYAQRLHELGHAAEAREQLGAAAALFHGVGDRLRGRAHMPASEPQPDRIPAVPAEHPLLAQLTPDERTVVDLVREGCRNREIAERVFVSLRTVEIRLTSVYRRFGVRSRTELLAKLAGTAEPVPA